MSPRRTLASTIDLRNYPPLHPRDDPGLAAALLGAPPCADALGDLVRAVDPPVRGGELPPGVLTLGAEGVDVGL